MVESTGSCGSRRNQIDTTLIISLEIQTPTTPSRLYTIPDSVEPAVSFEVSSSVIARAIKSFPNGSAGGLDRLRPQHLKDLLASIDDVDESAFVSALAAFTTLVLDGRTPTEVRPFFFGASLVALNKKSGGVRPIAVGCTLRHLVARLLVFLWWMTWLLC